MASWKDNLPRSVRRAGAAVLGYFSRLGRWLTVVRELRGASAVDQLKLLASAAASPLTALPKPFVWQNPEPLWDLQITSPGIGKFNIRKNTDDLWHVLPSREPRLLRELSERLSEGTTFVDAGANIGVYTILASKLAGASGKVVAIEMIPETARLLSGHIAANNCGNVRVVQNALSNEAGAVVTATMPRGKAGMASIAIDHQDDETIEFRVETTTLDHATADLDRIDLMKMDLEGAEPMALAGAQKTLEKTAAVVFEAHSDDGATGRLLEQAGFVVQVLDGKDMIAVRRVDG